eukprot:2898696-Amphidinium_carterae.1
MRDVMVRSATFEQRESNLAAGRKAQPEEVWIWLGWWSWCFWWFVPILGESLQELLKDDDEKTRANAAGALGCCTARKALNF